MMYNVQVIKDHGDARSHCIDNQLPANIHVPGTSHTYNTGIDTQHTGINYVIKPRAKIHQNKLIISSLAVERMESKNTVNLCEDYETCTIT